jgi:hypothetical protein
MRIKAAKRRVGEDLRGFVHTPKGRGSFSFKLKVLSKERDKPGAVPCTARLAMTAKEFGNGMYLLSIQGQPAGKCVSYYCGN